MKKVISALTAATMVASMTAGVMSAYAAYDAASIRYYLASGDDKATTATVSNDADQTVTIQTYIDCDTDGANVLTAGVGLDLPEGITFANGTSSLKDGTTDRTYTLSNGASFTSKRFVNCFDAYDADMEEVFNNCAVGGEWSTSVDEKPVWSWSTTNTDLTFISEKSDEVPLTEFAVTVPKGTAPGTYEIKLADTYQTPQVDEATGKNMEVGATYIGGQGYMQQIDTKGAFTITVTGDAPVTTDPEPTVEPTDAPTPTETTGSSVTPPVTLPDVNDKVDAAVNSGDFTWIIDDSVYGQVDGKEVKYGRIGLYVANDIGIYGYRFNILIDGKNPADLGFTYMLIRQTKENSYGFEMFAPNENLFGAGASVSSSDSGEGGGAENRSLPDGTMFCEILLTGGENVAPGTYEVTFDTSEVVAGNPRFSVMQADKTEHNPAIVAGSITIPGEQQDTTEGQEPTTEPQGGQDTTEPQGGQDTTEPQGEPTGDALYGDTDVNGKVQLRDVVMLNRFLTGYQNQQLSAQGTINANVYRNGESDADTTTANLTVDDSLTILKVLVGNVAQKDLPVQQ